MATGAKQRLQITIPPDLVPVLKAIAKRDCVPRATKAAQMIRDWIELEEDRVLGDIASARDTPNAKFISHEEAWKMFS